MGKTSSKVKDRWNAKAYDEIKVSVPKGEKETIQEAAAHGESVNAYIYAAIQQRMERESAQGGNDRGGSFGFSSPLLSHYVNSRFISHTNYKNIFAFLGKRA